MEIEEDTLYVADTVAAAFGWRMTNRYITTRDIVAIPVRYVVLPHTEHGPYHGGVAERSNTRVAERRYGAVDMYHEGTYAAFLPADTVLRGHEINDLLALSENPILCEDDYSALEWELTQDALEYAAQDVLRDLECRDIETTVEEITQILIGGLAFGSLVTHFEYAMSAEIVAPNQRLEDYVQAAL